MKVRTLNELQDLIDKDLSWRKRELTTIKFNVKRSKKIAKDTAIRAGIALLYAHWEGSIKSIATYYLCFVSCQKLPYSDMKKNFLAISSKNDIALFRETNKATLHNEIIKVLFSKYKQPSLIPYDNIIKTQSNLNSEVFKEIMATIGLDFSAYENSFKLIDETLLKARNCIAHGERLEQLSLDEARFNEIYDQINKLICFFAIQVSDAASLKEYLETA